MATGITEVITSGPLLLAAPVAAAAGALTFVSPCCLPLMPGYLSYVAGMAGADVQEGQQAGQNVGVSGAVNGGGHADGRRAARRLRTRTVAGTALFVLGFSVVFAAYGALFGGLGAALITYQKTLVQLLGVLVIVLGLAFMGVLDKVPLLQRSLKPAWRPACRAGGLPAAGGAVRAGPDAVHRPHPGGAEPVDSDRDRRRGALLAFVYRLGLGVPFLLAVIGLTRAMAMFDHARRHARAVMRASGTMLVIVGLLQVTGAWAPDAGLDHQLHPGL